MGVAGWSEWCWYASVCVRILDGWVCWFVACPPHTRVVVRRRAPQPQRSELGVLLPSTGRQVCVYRGERGPSQAKGGGSSFTGRGLNKYVSYRNSNSTAAVVVEVDGESPYCYTLGGNGAVFFLPVLIGCGGFSFVVESHGWDGNCGRVLLGGA